MNTEHVIKALERWRKAAAQEKPGEYPAESRQWRISSPVTDPKWGNDWYVVLECSGGPYCYGERSIEQTECTDSGLVAAVERVLMLFERNYRDTGGKREPGMVFSG